MSDFVRRLALALISSSLVACSQPPGESMTEADPGLSAEAAALETLFADEWASRMARNPLLASRMGVEGYDRLLSDVSPEAQARYLEEDRAFLERLDAIDRDALDDEQATNYELFRFVVGHRARRAEFRPYRIPILSDGGFHTWIQRMSESVAFDTVADYEDYLARLEAVGPYFAQNIENMRTGLEDGFTQPKAILDAMLPSITGAIVDDPEASIFYAPFRKMPAHFTAGDSERLRQAGRQVIGDSVIAAYRDYFEFFTDEYMPGARDTLGAASMPDGEAYYEELVRFYTTLADATPDSVHETGLAEVARIRAEMEEIIKAVEFDGTFADFIEFLRTDPQFYADTPEQLLKEASWIAKKVDGQMPAFFKTLPRLPYGVQPVPDDIAPNYTTGRYWGAPIGGRRGGYYMVNTYALDKRPLYTLPALTVHEGVPGHHHQSALRQELTGIPDFRRAFYPHAFGEGWGLYTEKLAIEMGIYETPYDDFGRLSYEMWRAVRLVVDTGMHYKGWTRQQAIDFLADNSALSLHNVRTEIDRYISWPGQALAYKIGEIRIVALREKAERELGELFDIREFHDAILLTGGLPMDMLEAEIDRYIAEVKADNRHQSE